VSIILEENEYNEEEDDNEDEEEDGDSLQSENEEEDDGDDESPVKKKRRHSRKPTKLVTSDDEFDTDIEIEGFFFCLLFLLISARNICYYKRSNIFSHEDILILRSLLQQFLSNILLFYYT